MEQKSVAEKILEKIVAGEMVMQDGKTDAAKLKAIKEFIDKMWNDAADVGLQCAVKNKLDRGLSACKFNTAFRSLEQRGLIASEIRMRPETWQKWRADDGFSDFADDNGSDIGIVGHLWTARIIALDFSYLATDEFEVIGSEGGRQGVRRVEHNMVACG